jgi:putative endonuclease
MRRALRRRLAELSPAIFVRLFSPTDPELGALGEEVAARHLRARGYTILGRRVKSALGEIDVLARDGATIVCVEVKSGRVSAVPRRKGAPRELDLRWRPGLRVDRARLAQLRRCARSLTSSGKQAARADLVEVLLDSVAHRWHVIHHVDPRAPLGSRGGFRPS